MHTDRLPPHNQDAEAGVLGCLLLDADAAIPDCGSLRPESMYDLRHRILYSVLLEMHDARTPIDLVTVTDRLRTAGKLEAAGGMSYLADLPDKVPSVAHLPAYAKIVEYNARLRTIIRAASEIVAKAYDAQDDSIEEAIDEAELAIHKLGDETSAQPVPRMIDLVGRAVNQIDEYHVGQGAVTGISSGFTDLDKLTHGFNPGEMIVIAARPGMGKTALAMQIAENAALEQALPVGVFSLEMTADALTMRMLCAQSRVNLRNIREGFLAERDFSNITKAAERIARANIYIDDSSALSIFQLRTKARRLAAQYGIRLFVVDYLQLLHSSSRKVDNRQQEIADISGGLKALSKELRVPVLVLSQLNREVERDGKRRPRLSDLRESGAIEQDADFVGLLYRPTKETDADEPVDNPEAGAVNLYIAKQRNGPSQMDVPLIFIRGYTRFESAAKISAVDEPQGND